MKSSERGAALIEYALLVLLISLAAYAGASSTLETVANNVDNSTRAINVGLGSICPPLDPDCVP